MKELLLFKKQFNFDTFFPLAPSNPDHIELSLIGGSLIDQSNKNRSPINSSDLLTVSSFDAGLGMGSLQTGSNKRLNYGLALPEPNLDEFTFECYIYLTGFIVQSPKYAYLFGKGDGINANEYTSWFISNTTTNNYFSIWPTGSTGNKNYIPANIEFNKLYHLAWCRKNNATDSQYLMFANGALNGNATTIQKTKALLAGNVPFTIGDRASGSAYNQYPWNGYLLGFRYTKGECIYTEDFPV